MAAQLVAELEWQSLTATINDIKSPGMFLQDLLFRERNTHGTQSLEIGRWTGDRKMVPFVKVGAQAFPVQGVGKAFTTVKAPNIRVKIAFNPSPLLFGRQPGTKVFVREGEDQLSAVQEHIAKDMQYMADQITNREEWMCAQALTGVITYSAADDLEAEAFEFDYSRDAAHSVTLTGADLWTSGTEDIAGDVRAAKRLVMEATGVLLTDAICGATAAEAFLNSAKVLAILERRNPEDDGPQILGGQPRPDGAYFMGRIFGVNWWEYARTIDDYAGNTVTLVDAKKVYLVSQSPDAGQSIEYAAIPDWDAVEDGLLQAQRFSKSWLEKDPSAVVALTHSRPFVLLKRPESMFEYQVIA
jgi:hypothetical protein